MIIEGQFDTSTHVSGSLRASEVRSDSAVGLDPFLLPLQGNHEVRLRVFIYVSG